MGGRNDNPEGASERKAGALLTQLKWKGPPWAKGAAQAARARRQPLPLQPPRGQAPDTHRFATATHIPACTLNTLQSHTPTLHGHQARTGRSHQHTQQTRAHTQVEGLTGTQATLAPRVTQGDTLEDWHPTDDSCQHRPRCRPQLNKQCFLPGRAAAKPAGQSLESGKI